MTLADTMDAEAEQPKLGHACRRRSAGERERTTKQWIRVARKETKRVAERPKRHELEQVVRATTEGVLLIEPDQRIVFANKAALVMHGVAPPAPSR